LARKNKIKTLESITGKEYSSVKSSNYFDKIQTGEYTANGNVLHFSSQAFNFQLSGIFLNKLVSFSNEFKTENANVIVTGSYKSQIPIIKNVNIENDFGKFDINISKLNGVLSTVFNNILYETNSPIKQEHKDAVSIKSRQSLHGITIGFYDGIIDESEEFESSNYDTKRVHKNTPKNGHIRSAQTRCYKKGDAKKVIAILPTIIHPEEWSAEMLKDNYFTPSGLPTVEGAYMFKGDVCKKDIAKLVADNKLPTMNEVYKNN
jgi:hypothetical protein